MQCLYASRNLVSAYMNPENAKWIDSPGNRGLRDFFVAYRDGAGTFSPLSYLEEALHYEEGDFDHLAEHDPADLLTRIFSALTAAQAKLVREAKHVNSDYPVASDETFIGKCLTSLLQSQC